MVTPKQAIEIADREGFCKLGQHVFLWKTCEASEHIKIEGNPAPYILITDPNGWKQPKKVYSHNNKFLIEVCQ